MNIFLVMTSTQEENEVCRAFLTEEEAQAYAATAREWYARKHDVLGGEWCPEGINRHHWGKEHRPDLVDEKLASSAEWPFGTDKCIEWFEVIEVPIGWSKPS